MVITDINTSLLLGAAVRLEYSLRTDSMVVNPIGIRTADMTPNTFNDFMCALWMDTFGQWKLKVYPCTTDPGLYWLQNPMNVKGTALVKPGHYKGSHAIGLHRGWEALVQVGNLTVYRDANRDGKYDLDENKTETGSDFAINIHRAGALQKSVVVGKWSAGCQVVADLNDHKDFMSQCRIGKSKDFDYTLFTEEELWKAG